MRFYYASLFSSVLWVLYCAIAVPLVWFILKSIRKRKLTWLSAGLSALVVAMLPWAEEFWIAFRFGELCRKDAGVFVYKTVNVAGFYDDTSAWGARQLSESKYQFVESNDKYSQRLLRVERTDDESRRRALAWYAENNPGKQPSPNEFLVHQVNVKERVVVSPNGADAWRVTTIDKPTARYRYKGVNNHTPVAHQIKRFENVVIDTETGERLGRYTNFYRGAYWFFIGLDRPTISCSEFEADVRKYGTFAVYSLTLKPTK